KTGMHEFVALKVISDAALKQPGIVDRFHREVRAVAALNHPNIITAYDADFVGKTHFLVMEYVEGKDVRIYIRGFGKLPIDWSVEVIRQTCLGLQHAFERDVAHRDVKPSNILVIDGDDADPPRVKILDMGLARFISEHQCTVLTTTGQALGTIDYIAPEQAEDTKRVDCRADVFSLGASFFHMVTGEVPFPGKNPMEKLMARAVKTAPPASSIQEDVPEEISHIIARMLEREPDDRYQTPQDVADDLNAFADGTFDASKCRAPVVPKREAGEASAAVHADADKTLNNFLDALGSEAAETESSAFRMAEERTEPESRPIPGRRKRKRANWIPVAASVGGVALLLLGLALIPWDSSPETKPEQPRNDEWLPDFIKEVSELPPEMQVVKVRHKMRMLNPRWSGGFTAEIKERKTVVGVSIHDADIQDALPLRALPHLVRLEIAGSSFSDLSPLKGMKITDLSCANTMVTDLSPLRDVPLTRLNLANTPVADLSPLQGKPLAFLNCAGTRVADVEPVAQAALEELRLNGSQVKDVSPLGGLKLTECHLAKTPVNDLSPLRGSPLVALTCDPSLVVKHAGLIRETSTLVTVNGMTRELFLKQIDMPDVLRRVVDALRSLNPEWTAPVDYELSEAGEIVELTLTGKTLQDVAPIAVLDKLKKLRVGSTGVSDLSPLRSLPLRTFHCQATPVSDLSPLAELPLTNLRCDRTKAEDLSPLKNLPLTSLHCDFQFERDMKLLLGMKSLKLLNGESADWLRSLVDGAGLSRVHFHADQSMKLFPLGHSDGKFPKQVTSDPLGPFYNQPLYF
ncbi:MAG: protein kinase, partial [Planctomycetales bacterium]